MFWPLSHVATRRRGAGSWGPAGGRRAGCSPGRAATDERGLEQGAGAAETLIPDGDHLPVRRSLALLREEEDAAVAISFSKSRAIGTVSHDVPDNHAQLSMRYKHGGQP